MDEVFLWQWHRPFILGMVRQSGKPLQLTDTCMILGTIIVTFLLLWGDTMTEIPYRKKSLLGSCSLRGLEFMNIMAGSMAAGRQAWWWIDNEELTSWSTRQRKWTGNGMDFWYTPNDTLPPTRPDLLILPKQFHWLGIKHSNILVPGTHFHLSHHRQIAQTPDMKFSIYMYIYV